MKRLTLIASVNALACGALLPVAAAHAADVSVVGLFPGKAVLVVNGAAPKTYSVGSTIAEGVRLAATDQSTATIEINGKRQRIAMGEYVNRTAPSGPASVTLSADSRGHFIASCQINDGAVRMVVDTGATLIALPASDALRLGIDYKRGQPTMVSTANGMAPAYRVMLNTVKVGDIRLDQVEALVQENGLPFILLGMSFLNRTDMRRDGDRMVLTKRF